MTAEIGQPLSVHGEHNLVSDCLNLPASLHILSHLHQRWLLTNSCCLCVQDEARRLAEQVHVLEDTRSRWNAEVAAKEASLAAKEEALSANSRQRDADQRRRLDQDHQVSVDKQQNLNATMLIPNALWHLPFGLACISQKICTAAHIVIGR